jgi:hypothetical protein
MNQSNSDPMLFAYLYSINMEYQSNILNSNQRKSKSKSKKNKTKLSKNEQINNMLSSMNYFYRYKYMIIFF